MIRGKVGGNQQALVPLDINDGNGRPHRLEVIIDTGFTGHLALPPEFIRVLDLPFVGQRIFELANGEHFEFAAYLATVSWHGRLRDALVLQSDSVPLLGMTLLWGSRVTVDALDDGAVIIEELSSVK